jgi:hypothetical protein
MEFNKNTHLDLVGHFYVKPHFLATDMKTSISASTSASTKKQTPSGSIIDFNWKFGNIPNDKFNLPENEGKLDNYSFVNSILYTIDNLYYTSNVQQKMRDCKEFIEMVRSKIYKGKLTKEESDVVKNLENNEYTDSTIQSIVNYLDIFHLIIISNDGPKLFVNKRAKKNVPDYTSAGNLVVIYYDTTRERYSPLEYNLENRETFYISWKEKAFLELLKKFYLYGKPAETKNWAVADLRDWITFFKLPIDISLAKKDIVDKIGKMGLN